MYFCFVRLQGKIFEVDSGSAKKTMKKANNHHFRWNGTERNGKQNGTERNGRVLKLGGTERNGTDGTARSLCIIVPATRLRSVLVEAKLIFSYIDLYWY